MNRVKPICQMTLVQNKNNSPSLIFSSELENEQVQSPLFCIPIYYTLTKIENLKKYLIESSIYMPFSIGDKTVNINAEIDFPFVRIPINKYSQNENIQYINFIVEISKYSEYEEKQSNNSKQYLKILTQFKQIFSKYTDTEFLTLNYIGNWNKIDKSNTKFLIIRPIDITLLENLFWEDKITPVGLTPNFGFYDNQEKI